SQTHPIPSPPIPNPSQPTNLALSPLVPSFPRSLFTSSHLFTPLPLLHTAPRLSTPLPPLPASSASAPSLPRFSPPSPTLPPPPLRPLAVGRRRQPSQLCARSTNPLEARYVD